jgi:hypothetical protein
MLSSFSKIDRNYGYASGCQPGEEVFLLCEKVTKQDIEVVFTEYNDQG